MFNKLENKKESNITPYQITKEIYDKSQNIEKNILDSVKQTLETAKDIREIFKPVIEKITIVDIFEEICAIDGGNSYEEPKMGWYFGTHGAVLLSNKENLKSKGDIITCPASGDMIRYNQLCRDIDQISLGIESDKNSNKLIFFDGSSIPLGWYVRRDLPFAFKGFGRYEPYDNILDKCFFNNKSKYNQFFNNLDDTPMVFVPKTSVSSVYINRKLKHFKVPEGLPDVVLLSMVLKEGEYINPPIPYYECQAYTEYSHYNTSSNWAYYFGDNASQIYVTYFRPSRRSPVFKIEFHKAHIGKLEKILNTFKVNYNPVAKLPFPLYLADRLAKCFSHMNIMVTQITKNNLIELCEQMDDVELLKAVELFFH